MIPSLLSDGTFIYCQGNHLANDTQNDSLFKPFRHIIYPLFPIPAVVDRLPRCSRPPYLCVPVHFLLVLLQVAEAEMKGGFGERDRH